jgi:DNA-binding transcriptional LysR family regulator
MREGKADVALLCASEDVDRLDSADVGVENPVALVPESHRWATRSRLTPQLLRRDPSYRSECPREGVDELVERVALGKLVVVVGDSVVERLGHAVPAMPVAGVAPPELLTGVVRRLPRPTDSRAARSGAPARRRACTVSSLRMKTSGAVS